MTHVSVVYVWVSLFFLSYWCLSDTPYIPWVCIFFHWLHCLILSFFFANQKKIKNMDSVERTRNHLWHMHTYKKFTCEDSCSQNISPLQNKISTWFKFLSHHTFELKLTSIYYCISIKINNHFLWSERSRIYFTCLFASIKSGAPRKSSCRITLSDNQIKGPSLYFNSNLLSRSKLDQ